MFINKLIVDIRFKKCSFNSFAAENGITVEKKLILKNGYVPRNDNLNICETFLARTIS